MLLIQKVPSWFSAIELLIIYLNIRSLIFTMDDTKRGEEMHYEPKYMYVSNSEMSPEYLNNDLLRARL